MQCLVMHLKNVNLAKKKTLEYEGSLLLGSLPVLTIKPSLRRVTHGMAGEADGGQRAVRRSLPTKSQ